MNPSPVILRNLVIYAICIPLAFFLGYQLSEPFTYETLITVGGVFMALITPVLLRWHRPILFFAINASILLPFWGRPKFGLVMVAVSFGVSILQRILQQRFRFISAPEITRPLLVIMAVLCFTAFLRGGIGIRAFGSSSVGASRYLMLMLGVMSFFAMTAQPIPANRRNAYLALFFLGGVTAVVGDLVSVVSPSLYFIYWVFPVNVAQAAAIEELSFGAVRLMGFTILGGSIMNYLLGRFGLRGVFASGNRWRLLAFFGLQVLMFLGGFRSVFIHLAMLLTFMFFLERLHRTRAMMPVILGGILCMTSILVFLPHLPFTFQRSLAILPVNVSPEARLDADSSSQWRIAMWKAVLPEVPNYLLLGKGLSFSEADFEANTSRELSSRNPDQWLWAVITGDYHNGPLSAVLTFGLWGLIALVWFHIAGLRVMWMAYKNGAPDVQLMNSFLLAKYLTHLVSFWFVTGSMYTETIIFASLLGFSVALNNGVCRVPFAAAASTAPAVPTPIPLRRPRPALVGVPGHAAATREP